MACATPSSCCVDRFRTAGRSVPPTTRNTRDLWAWFSEEVSKLGHASTDADASLEHWVDVVRRDGVRGSIIEHRIRLTAALAVLRALPTDGVSLAALADDLLGDPHALDTGRSCSRLVLSALAARGSIEPPSHAEGVRSLWERPVSSPTRCRRPS